MRARAPSPTQIPAGNDVSAAPTRGSQRASQSASHGPSWPGSNPTNGRRSSPGPQPTPTGSDRRHLLDVPPEAFEAELQPLLSELSERPFRTRQLRDWIYRRLAVSFDEMTDLPERLRAALAERYVLTSLTEVDRALSSDTTEKFIWRLGDGREVESVSIPTAAKLTYCISSQVGCPLACSFCATGKLGYTRQLTAGEIVDQVRTLLRLTHGVRRAHSSPATLPDRTPTSREPNLVFMGMGEPLLNLRNLLPALAALNSELGLQFGARRITVSTAGVAPHIADLAAFNPQIKLAISLHAPTDALRDELVPLNRRYPLARLMEACREFARVTRKRITFEYIHLPDVNDLPEHPRELRDLLGSLPAKINLIPYNPVPGVAYRAPTLAESEAYVARLRRTVPCSVTLRRPRGSDIGGACGQLELERRHAKLPEPLLALGGS
ncbi:MAG: 23S rRNA (adenine(2503)-C(2))-methyltransferase RlmN [Gemmatimonadetes bacterium]|nr:23S rRNA (adenine(2503)-C(2))-methyltransferase RlmN [Gemmatimonadota bacterium]